MRMLRRLRPDRRQARAISIALLLLCLDYTIDTHGCAEIMWFAGGIASAAVWLLTSG
jgi:hypothetical protein